MLRSSLRAFMSTIVVTPCSLTWFYCTIPLLAFLLYHGEKPGAIDGMRHHGRKKTFNSILPWHHIFHHNVFGNVVRDPGCHTRAVQRIYCL
ncbi:hypothetical protein CC86DRAFT_181255 [Ophiobolus disseminans]|uniref:Uncharacterized protein n=1 Tax=Ophiobolus disseminans TaxID=1469910 RepID=A0A6A7AAC9_9PLEO|nr:hypothetical protein CC86DRAFT_181255 [Ophiobolus disseminans]